MTLPLAEIARQWLLFDHASRLSPATLDRFAKTTW